MMLAAVSIATWSGPLLYANSTGGRTVMSRVARAAPAAVQMITPRVAASGRFSAHWAGTGSDSLTRQGARGVALLFRSSLRAALLVALVRCPYQPSALHHSGPHGV